MVKFAFLAFAIIVSGAGATLWQDCGLPNATVHFTNVASDPDPLHTGENQTISKMGWSDSNLGDNFTASFSQYWCPGYCKDSKTGKIKWQLGLPWVRFLKINVDVCQEHKDMCPLVAGHNFTTSAVHPKLNPLTPHGWYRSRQVYHDVNGREVGCADMIIEYLSK
eukprot:g2650.t1